MVAEAAWIPEEGELIWISMNPQAGHEQAGRRPAVVLTPAAYNGMTGLAVLCPITSRSKGYPFEVQLPVGCGVEGVILADQVKSLDWQSRQADRIGRCGVDTLRLVRDKLGLLLGV